MPKGVISGTTLRVATKGNQSLSGIAGDLLIKVNVREHPFFKRKGSDIHTDKYITYTQAVLGAKLKVQTIHGY